MKPPCDLGRVWNAVKVAELMDFIEDQHFDVIFGKPFKIVSSGVVGCNNRTQLTGRGGKQIVFPAR